MEPQDEAPQLDSDSAEQDSGDGPLIPVGEGSGASLLPPISPLRSLSARVLFLVALLVVGSSASAWALLIKQRRLLADLHLLTKVYVPFEQGLAQARAADTQLRRYRLQLMENTEVQNQPGADLVLQAAMEHRGGLVRTLRAPLQEMLDSSKGWSEQHRGPVQELIGGLELLESLVENDELSAESLSSEEGTNAAVSLVNRIDRLFRVLESRAKVVRTVHDDAVSHAGRRAERYTWLVSLASLVLGLITALAALWTLRPLPRLTQRVLRLGSGDWSGDWSGLVSQDFPASRDNEVTRLSREFERMAIALRDREQQLIHSERMAAIGQMAAQITHEIRNPLSSVALNVELLEDELEEVGAGPDTRELLHRVNAEVDRLAEITESYLSFARRRPPEMEELDLGALLGQILDFLAAEHQRAEIEVHRDLGEPGRFWVRGDPRQLRQALLNLLRNAQEAILEGEGSPLRDAPRRIEVEIEGPAPVKVRIADSGPGIAGSQEDWSRIFEPFVSHKAQGTGLGLPMVQQILQAHAGNVRILRTGPSGTQFELSFPACQGR